jgi:16S rRNA G1207 methylase RsmC
VAEHEVGRWLVGAPAAAAAGDRLVGLVDPDPAAVPFHEAVDADLPRAAEVEIWLPGYRGKSLVPLLGWLVAGRLAAPDATVTWVVDRRQGPDSVARLLAGLGWRDLARDRDGRTVRLAGRAPADPPWPAPRRFTATFGTRELSFDADYGVFSPNRVDDGTALLAEVALAGPPVEVLADIGTGYGPLAVGLVAGGLAGRAVATDVDCLALWLAARNAARHGVPVRVACQADPAAVEPTGLTVCNVPTHLDTARSAAFMTGLAARARHGRLLVVVHRSLEQRYARHLTGAGLDLARHPGPDHTVLASTGRAG